ncbi:micrococcal nuclease-like nuclease [Cylindrospermum stagnale PCC 7417]|uniref:Micrococcal nuclease-like nuclease n=1 Tax=Cylindrospermum stagnale PCC 7417 TaxID=56107 RepID=K9X5B6_9NOST|nr:thermonuclease family protein [Cylindrospermum stagnale]AFZ27261.1 micrococcal nuclease-like nuclease [Cylindrospermum stagnale PCC 7417]
MKPLFINLLITLSVIGAAAALYPRTKLLVEEVADSTLPRLMPVSEDWTATSVADGDTITVKRGNETKKIRLCGINAPEGKHGKATGQPHGDEAKEKLRSLVALAKNQVIIIPIETDRYGRTVAEVVAEVSGAWGIELSFQEEMLKSGNAYFDSNALNCPNHDAFEKAEQIAKANGAGVWGKRKRENLE